MIYLKLAKGIDVIIYIYIYMNRTVKQPKQHYHQIKECLEKKEREKLNIDAIEIKFQQSPKDLRTKQR